LSGDFYREQDDVYRGVTLCSEDVALCKVAAKEVQPTTGQLSFQPTDTPPQLPIDGCCTVEATTLYLSHEEPWIAANRLLSFLDDEATAHIKKVNRSKFTVKLEALWQGLTCEVKVRVYRMVRSSQCAFEFQRVGGDCLAFNGLFRLVQQLLCPLKNECVGDAGHSFSPPPPPPFEKADSEFVSLLPLIDAAQNAEDVTAQAEAAAALASVAEDERATAQLCSPRACAAIRRLLQVNRFEVSCQVTRLLSKLALFPGAEVCFFAEGILHLIFDKVLGLSTGKLLQDQLAKAVYGLISRTAKLPRQATASRDHHEVLRMAAMWLPDPARAMKAHL